LTEILTIDYWCGTVCFVLYYANSCGLDFIQVFIWYPITILYDFKNNLTDMNKRLYENIWNKYSNIYKKVDISNLFFNTYPTLRILKEMLFEKLFFFSK